MYKLKSKILRLFFKLRRLLVVFGLSLCLFVFFLALPASADSFVPSQQEEGLKVIDVANDTTTTVRPYVTGSTFKYTWRYSHAGDYHLSVWYALPAVYYQYTGMLSATYYLNSSVGGLLSNVSVYLVMNDGQNRLTPTATGTETVDGQVMDYYTFTTSAITFNSLRFGFYTEVYAGNPGASTMPLLVTTSFDFVPISGPPQPTPPQSSAENNNYPIPDGSVASESDEIESDLVRDSNNAFVSGFNWFLGFQRFLDNTWTLQALSGITKFINYLTGQEIMNGQLYSDWDYFMKPLFFALAIGILPFIIGLPLRFLRNTKSK